MSSLSIWLLRLAQYYGIIFGFTYIYIDDKERRIKIYNIVKIYAHVINILYIVITIRFQFYIFKNSIVFLDKYTILMYVGDIKSLLQVGICLSLIVLRLKEEKFLLNYIQLHTTYLDKVLDISVDGTIKNAMILNIFNIISYSLCFVINEIICKINEDKWLIWRTDIYQNYIIAMEHYVLLHHALILCYINHNFKIINHQLQHGYMQPDIFNIYKELSLILKIVSKLNGPLIFFVLICMILENSLSVCYTLSVNTNETFFDTANYYDFYVFIIFCVDIFVYFLLCGRLQNTTKETGRILLEYSERENYQKQVEIFGLGYLTMELKVNICEIFTVDFGALFMLMSQLVTLIIILVQTEYWVISYRLD